MQINNYSMDARAFFDGCPGFFPGFFFAILFRTT